MSLNRSPLPCCAVTCERSQRPCTRRSPSKNLLAHFTVGDKEREHGEEHQPHNHHERHQRYT